MKNQYLPIICAAGLALPLSSQAATVTWGSVSTIIDATTIVTTGVTTDAPEFAEFNKAFEAKHGLQANIYTYYGLDALMAIVHAIGEAAKKGEVTPTAVRDALETMTDVQLFTSVVTMEPDTHNPHNKPLLIMSIQDSQWKLLETFQPE